MNPYILLVEDNPGDASESLGMAAVAAGAQDYLIKGTLDAKHLRRAMGFAIQRTRLEQNLATALAQARDLYENAPCGYHSLDADGRFLHINATALDWLGCTHP